MPDPNRDQGALGEEMPPERDSRELIEPTRAWTGLPAFEAAAPREIRLVLAFDTEEEREQLVAKLELIIAKKTKGTWSAWWPPRDREDLSSLRFDFGAAEQGEPDPCKHEGNMDQQESGHWICEECGAVLPDPDDDGPGQADLREGRDAAIGAAPENEGDSDEPTAEGGMIA